MLKYGGITFCVLAIVFLCLFVDIKCSILSREARMVHRNMEIRLTSFQNELSKASLDIEDIRVSRGSCTCPAPNVTATVVNLEQTGQKKEAIGGQSLRTYEAREKKAYSDEKKARKRFEHMIKTLVQHHIKSQEKGIWTTWSSWGICSMSCGVGLQRRDRTCTQPTPGPHGDPCVGDASEYQLCSIGTCAGIWTTWSSWGKCSMSCGVGLQTRDRTCTQPAPGPHGNPCVGDASDYKVCSIGACADDRWSAWGPWGSCSATCNGGMRNRHRSCDNPDPSLLGKTCIGNSVESKNCNNKNCPNPTVFFTVTTPSKTLTTNDRPIFSNVLANEGDGYDMETAIFTCPVAGLYMFSFTFIQSSTSSTDCSLYHNHYLVAQVYTRTNDHWASASGSVFVRLNREDTFDARNCQGWNNVDSYSSGIFTGALVTPS